MVLLITVLWILRLLHICVHFRAVVEAGVCVCVCVCVYVVSAIRNMLRLDDVILLKTFYKKP